MPSWFGNKSSTKDAKKKKTLENMFDGTRRKLKLKQIKEENRSSSLDSGSDASSLWSGSRSPGIVTLDDASTHAPESQPLPLPCAPPARTDSGKCAHIASSPSLPLPSPEQSSTTEDVTEGEGCISAYGSGSTSSACSQESMSVMDAWSNNGSSNLMFPSQRTPAEDTTNGFEQKGFGIAQAGLSPRYSSLSPRQGYSQASSPHLIRRFSDNHADAVAHASSPLLHRRYSDNHVDAIAQIRNGVTGHLDSPVRSPRKTFGADPLSGVFFKGGVSPEPSAAPSPKGRSLGPSPGPSPRILSAAVSPLHPRASAGAQDSLNGRHKSEAHPLPLPPSAPPGSYPPPPPPAVLRSPERPVNFQTGWRKGTLLGSGTFGQVYTGFHSESGQSCAIKEVVIIPDNEKSMESAKQLMQEVSLLSQMKHANIVQYYGSEMIDDRLYIYLELMTNGSIHKLIQQYGPLSESCMRVYTRQILCGLSYLHGKNTVHRDIKGANILVDKGGVVKLADFGMAKHISAQSCPLSLKGSPYWMAPEVIKNINGYDFAVDIWSLGCTVLEMATGKPPWCEFEGIAAVFKIGNSKEIPLIPKFLSEDGKTFLRSCLQRDPHNRPTATQLLDHPFVNIHRCDYQLDVSELMTSAMQGMRVMEMKWHQKTVSHGGDFFVPLTPSVSCQPQFYTEDPNFNVFPPSSQVPNSTFLPGVHGGGVHHGNTLAKSLPCHEILIKSPKSPRSPKSPVGSDLKKYPGARTEPRWGTSQTPDSSPRHQNLYMWGEEFSASAACQVPGDGVEASQRFNMGGMRYRMEHHSQHSTQIPQQYYAMPVQPGSPTLLGHVKSHASGSHAESRHRI